MTYEVKREVQRMKTRRIVVVGLIATAIMDDVSQV